MIDKPMQVIPPESIDIETPGFGVALKGVLAVFKLTQPKPRDEVITLLTDISRDVKNTYNVTLAAISEQQLVTQTQIILDCLEKVQGLVAIEFGADGRSGLTQEKLNAQFDRLNGSITVSKSAIATLLGTYERNQENTQQLLSEYIGGYCYYVAQYLSNLSAAFQVYRIYLDDNAAKWESLNSTDKEMSVIFSMWQKGLKDDLNMLCKVTLPAHNPKCYRPIFENREFFLSWGSGEHECLYMDNHKNNLYTACHNKKDRISAKFRVDFPAALNTEYSWTIQIDGQMAVFLTHPASRLPNSDGGSPLFTSLNGIAEFNFRYRLEHNRQGLRLSTSYYGDKKKKPVYMQNPGGVITWQYGSNSSQFWHVRDIKGVG